jgi:hypothetical protein
MSISFFTNHPFAISYKHQNSHFSRKEKTLMILSVIAGFAFLGVVAFFATSYAIRKRKIKQLARYDLKVDVRRTDKLSSTLLNGSKQVKFSKTPFSPPINILAPVPVTAPINILAPVPVTAPINIPAPVPVTAPINIPAPVPVTAPINIPASVTVAVPINTVERSDQEAARYYRLAADQGNARAQGNLQTMYANGRGIEQGAGHRKNDPVS